jgi:drug/metabolite transporter (DMT)-like permease
MIPFFRGHPGALQWLLFAVLCIIWGSSFVLMKLGMYGGEGQPEILLPYEVAALRMLSAGLCFVPFCVQAFRRTKRAGKLRHAFVSGLLGSFAPAFLFCLAETEINSSVAAILNATTPLFVVLIGTLFFAQRVPFVSWLGISIGLAGCCLLFLPGGGANGFSWFAVLACCATLCYGINVHWVRHHLAQVGSVDIASVSFVLLVLPATGVLLATGFFTKASLSSSWMRAVGASMVLGVLGTALASVLFYMLVKRAGALFASLVTYGIPFVAFGWSVLYGETLQWFHVLALLVILWGVNLAHARRIAKSRAS